MTAGLIRVWRSCEHGCRAGPRQPCAPRPGRCAGCRTTSRASAGTRATSPCSVSRRGRVRSRGPPRAGGDRQPSPRRSAEHSAHVLHSRLRREIAAEICSEVGRAPTVADLADVPRDDLVAAAATMFGRSPQQTDRWAPVAYTNPRAGSGSTPRPWAWSASAAAMPALSTQACAWTGRRARPRAGSCRRAPRARSPGRRGARARGRGGCRRRRPPRRRGRSRALHPATRMERRIEAKP